MLVCFVSGSHRSKNRLETLIAEHLDHLHYVNDILSIDNEYLNDVLTEHMLNRLLVPLYVDSLTRKRAYGLAVSGLEKIFLCWLLSFPSEGIASFKAS